MKQERTLTTVSWPLLRAVLEVLNLNQKKGYINYSTKEHYDKELYMFSSLS